MAIPQNTEKEEGPFAYENWQAAEAGESLISAFEFPLFTDAPMIGEIGSGLGPYQILNTVPVTTTREFAPALILRAEYHVQFDPLSKKSEKTDVRRYHGGLLSDEITALVSLCLGIRLKAGGCTREFVPDGDPKGRPTATELYRNPIPTIPTKRAAVLPRALGEHRLDKVSILGRLPLISPASAIALIRAARLYQDAIWVAESEPHLSWVMLVSAVEAAAGHWRTTKDSPVERLNASRPDLVTLLRTAGGEDLLNQVADRIADYIGATKKFIDFILEFLPEPPEERPVEALQHSWDRNAMQESMRIIYDWRSRALHGGTPFPFPMCEPPFRFESGYCEKPVGLATHAFGAYWVAKDTPMLLHTFEYVVRKTLLNWWASIAEN